MIALSLASVLSLAQLERDALERSPAIAAARGKVLEERAVLDGARASGAPHAVANYNAQPQAGNLNQTVTQQLTTISGQVAINDLVVRNAAIRAARATLDAALANERDVERAEQIKVIGLYVDLAKTAELERLSANVVTATRADRNAAALRYAAGDAPHLDVVRADVATASAQADDASAIAAFSNARDALATETGDPDVEVAPLPAAIETSAIGTDANAAVAYAIAHRTEIAVAAADLDASRAAEAGAHAAAIPAITAALGYASGVDTGVHVSGPAANVTVDVPLSGAAATSARDVAQAQVAQAQARYDAAVQTVSLEVRSSLVSIRAQREAAGAADVARREAAAEVDAALVGYREGASSSLELNDARKTYAQALASDVQARAALYEAVLTYQLDRGETP